MFGIICIWESTFEAVSFMKSEHKASILHENSFSEMTFSVSIKHTRFWRLGTKNVKYLYNNTLNILHTEIIFKYTGLNIIY